MFSIFNKEIYLYFSSLSAYIIMIFFITCVGIMVWVYPNINILAGGYADLSIFFTISPYIYSFLIPAITMNMISEEFNTGTMELLITSSKSIYDIILGKYLATVCIIFIILIFTIIYPISLYFLSIPEGSIDIGSIMGSYFGLFCLCLLFAAIGIFTSACVRSSLIAFLLGSVLCVFLFKGFDVIANLIQWNKYVLQIMNIGILSHYDSLSKGLINTNDINYFVILIIFFIYLSNRCIRNNLK